MNIQPLPVLEAEGSCRCCNATEGTSTTTTLKESAMNTQSFPVTGMTCGHCVGAVTSELKNVAGVTQVKVDLVAGGTSTVTVTSDAPVNEQDVAAALDEAGDYQLVTS